MWDGSGISAKGEAMDGGIWCEIVMLVAPNLVPLLQVQPDGDQVHRVRQWL